MKENEDLLIFSWLLMEVLTKTDDGFANRFSFYRKKFADSSLVEKRLSSNDI
jgi:hypothetical protein